MLIAEVAKLVLDAQQVQASCLETGGYCYGSTFTQIGAAFATQGYYVQADLLEYLTGTDFGLWAPLIWLLAAAAGLVSLAMGLPPKMYLWFLFGPALYNYLLGTRDGAHGVEWRVGGTVQDQREVWASAEVGLRNLNIVQRKGISVFKDRAPSQDAQVSNIFLWIDYLISGTTQALVEWTGVFSQADGGGVNSTVNSNAGVSTGSDRWYLMSQLKWSYLQNVTDARLHSGSLRDAFSTFLSSECGDALASKVDDKSFTAAANSRTGRIPCSVFTGAGLPSSVSDCQNIEPDYWQVALDLKNVKVPTPQSLRDLIADDEVGSYRRFFPNNDGNNIQSTLKDNDNLNCVDYFYLLIHGFRWETGHIYHQLVATAPLGMNDNDFIFNLFYGWDLRDMGDAHLYGEQLRRYLQDLILVHLFRNEMLMTKRLVDRRFRSSSEEVQGNAETYLATSGSKAKYAEVYTWAMMVPYIQGVLFYLLAMGYPFACILIVAPGMHKAFLTWTTFWVWVKLWDVGFAIVMVLERSIWSMVGREIVSSNLNRMIYPMQTWNNSWVTVQDCHVTSLTGSNDCPAIPTVVDGGLIQGMDALRDTLKIFDRALIVGASLRYDVANAYYIYIMAALYFAVPAVTGQLVLGAKAGAAGMVSSAIGGVASEAGRGASSGFTADLGKKAQAANAAVGQEAYAKAMRQGGLAAGAINAGNMGLKEGMNASTYGQMSQGLGAQSSAIRMGLDTFGSANQAQAAEQRHDLSKVQGGINAGAGVGRNLEAVVGRKIGALENSTTASHPNGAIGTRMQGASGIGQDIAGAFLGPAGQRIDASAQAGGYSMASQANEQMAGINATQAGLGIRQFGASSSQAGHGMAERRLGAQAEFAAQTAAWGARMQMANQNAGTLGAMGVDTSFMSPGNKPTDMMGMAMTGMLGSAAKSEGNYASAGGAYWSQQDKRVAGLNKSYGESSAWGMYQHTSPGSARAFSDASYGGFDKTDGQKLAFSRPAASPPPSRQ